MELRLSVSPKSGNAGPGGKVRVVAAISGIDYPPEVLLTFLSTEQPAVAPVLQMASGDGGSKFHASLDVHLPVPGFHRSAKEWICKRWKCFLWYRRCNEIRSCLNLLCSIVQ